MSRPHEPHRSTSPRRLLRLARHLAWPLGLLGVVGCEPQDGASTGGGEGGGGTTGTTSLPDDPSPSPCGETPNAPAFEIGTGEVCFEPLARGDVVPRIAGPQGGYHVWASLLCADCPTDVVVVTALADAEGERWVGEPSERAVELRSGQVAGLFALLAGTTQNPEGVLPEGTPVRIAVEVRTLEGAMLHAGAVPVVLGELELWLNQCDDDPTTCGKPDAMKCCT